MQPKVGRGPDDRAHLVERSVALERIDELARFVRVAEPCPRDEVRAWCDRGGRVDLQDSQVIDDLKQIGRPTGFEQLRSNRDPPCLGLR